MNLDNMREMLIANEGLSLKVYKCTAGANSIGVGRNLDSRGISEDEAMLMLTNDIDICIAALDKRYPWWKRLSEARQEVMVDLMFNLGESRLAKFVQFLQSMETASSAEDYAVAAEHLLDSLYAKQLPGRSKRNAEIIRGG
ncbi:MAG: lysozyme [Pseudomonadota bacterium]|nr:lysozyme [Pseudomonadota bacterium]MEC7552629.1 lysozyme [Pseudomonadota bacterium]